MRFCTIASPARLAHARVLARGLAGHHPGTRLTVLVLGPEHIAAGTEPFDVLRPRELQAPGADALLAECRWPDLAELMKPHLLRRLIADGTDHVVFLDSATDVHAPLDPVVRALERHSAVTAPRVLGELPDDAHRPDQADLRRGGHLSPALLGLRHDPAALELLEWWAQRLARESGRLTLSPLEVRHGRGRGPVRWLDLAPAVFAGLSMLTDPGLAVSHWNLHERRLEGDGTDTTVNDRPLRLFSFEGFDPGRPFLLRPGSDRVRTSDNLVLAELCASYAERLREAGWRDARLRAEVGRELPNGMTFDDRLSILLGQAAEDGQEPADVFTEEGCESFMRWLEAPLPGLARFGINRYLLQVYFERDDLQTAYPRLDGPDAEEFAGWAWVFGIEEMGIPDRFRPSRPAWAGPPAPSVEQAVAGTPPLPRGDRPDLSMNVTGMLTGTLGLGEAARGYVRALEAAAVPVSTSTVDVREFLTVTRDAHEGYGMVEYADIEGVEPAGFSLICINADELIRFAEVVGPDFLRQRPSIGVWAWETDHIPDRWHAAFSLLDEIWVYSTYVADNLERVSPIPVRRIPPPVSPPDAGDVELELGVPDGYQFLFMFDFFSTIQRKNPVGLIQAFRLAFAPDEGPQLLIKTINGVHRPEALEEVRWAARGRSDIHVVDRSLSARERDALVAGCDCYVSLHRSEGFGLTLAECMALGKPVIGTAYSATTDFMTAENSYPVPYSMTRVGPDCEVYPPQGTWADPDVEEAASAMRRVIEQPDEARTRGERARQDIERLYLPETVGGLMRTRLEELIALWR